MALKPKGHAMTRVALGLRAIACLNSNLRPRTRRAVNSMGYGWPSHCMVAQHDASEGARRGWGAA